MKRRTKTQEEVNWTPEEGKSAQNIVTDPNGMYTGRPKDRYEVPVQDADDL